MLKSFLFFIIAVAGVSCIEPEPDCTSPLVTGPCKAYLRRYGFSTKLGKCKQFIYGGCAGNRNQYTSLAACQKKCESPDCTSPLVTGPCRAAIKRYGFDTKLGKCRQFTYGGCAGNSNNYETLAECQDKCDSPDTICYQSIDSGICYGYMPMYAYNATSGECTQFIYGGCGGNSNRFETIEECQDTCENSCD